MRLLENTYKEWKASRFAREGVQCQDCHMPDRRHRWRGVHDARAALEASRRSPFTVFERELTLS